MADVGKRYQVFVSSTFLDLQVERQAVISALLECDAFPAGMELFPAADDDAWTLIQRVIEESDYYLLVMGGKYGSVEPNSNVSYTEMEYDYATSLGKPVMAFLHRNPQKIEFGKSESDNDRREQLDSFRSKVESEKHVKQWESADSLAGAVALTFNGFTKNYPAVGWIRADQGTSTESLQELAMARRRIDELEAQVEHQRVAPPPGTEGLAQGSDTFDLPVLSTIEYLNSSAESTTIRTWGRLPLTWDELLSVLGPRLLQDCEEDMLRKPLVDFLNVWKYEELAAATVRRLRDDGTDVVDDPLPSVSDPAVDDEDLDTIVIQLNALGLIEQSQKKRSVSDTGRYWTLTPYGQTRTIQLRALKSGSSTRPTSPAAGGV